MSLFYPLPSTSHSHFMRDNDSSQFYHQQQQQQQYSQEETSPDDLSTLFSSDTFSLESARDRDLLALSRALTASLSSESEGERAGMLGLSMMGGPARRGSETNYNSNPYGYEFSPPTSLHNSNNSSNNNNNNIFLRSHSNSYSYSNPPSTHTGVEMQTPHGTPLPSAPLQLYDSPSSAPTSGETFLSDTPSRPVPLPTSNPFLASIPTATSAGRRAPNVSRDRSFDYTDGRKIEREIEGPPPSYLESLSSRYPDEEEDVEMS